MGVMAEHGEIPGVTLASGVVMPLVGFGTWQLRGNAGRERVTLAASLRALDLDRVDLWLVHWPPGDRASPAVWRKLLACRDEGLARAVGVSNYSVSQIDELTEATGEAPAVNQIPWSPPGHDPNRRSPTGSRPTSTCSASP
jgi:2,5-diketo-D-gluconate reductase A